jgi:type IV pilus assembly protein PilY1
VGSVSNKAVLYALDALTGAVLNKLETADAGGVRANGLSPPALLYAAGKRLIHAYAGDLRGRLWRFDLAGPPSTWTVGFAGSPLFTATGPGGREQPITAKPRIASDRLSGRIILFGTGRLLTSADPRNHWIQTVYGVFDRFSGGTATRSDLTAQTIVSDTAGSRTVSDNPVPPGSSGWYLDLTGTPTSVGERVVSAIGYLPEASLITVSTVQPLPGNVCRGGYPYASWVMTLSPFTGKAINLFAGAGAGTQAAGRRLENVMAGGTPIRKGYSSIKLGFSDGSGTIRQIDLSRGWNPRSAWQQIR